MPDADRGSRDPAGRSEGCAPVFLAASGQTGRLFLPFNAALGRKVTDNIVVSLEIGTALIRHYPVYRHKAEFRVTSEF